LYLCSYNLDGSITVLAVRQPIRQPPRGGLTAPSIVTHDPGSFMGFSSVATMWTLTSTGLHGACQPICASNHTLAAARFSPLWMLTIGVKSCHRDHQPAPIGVHPACPARSGEHRPSTCFLAELHTKCFSCLSSSHQVVTCRLPPCCLSYRAFRHLARDCKRRWRVPPTSSSG
jgi:hypothetical protein